MKKENKEERWKVDTYAIFFMHADNANLYSENHYF